MQDTLLETTTTTTTAAAAVQRIALLPALLDVLGRISGMGFMVVSSVTEHSWLACAVHDRIAFGITPNQQLDVGTTFCRDVRLSQRPLMIDQASVDPRYRDHLTPRIYGFESYISLPIVAADSSYFGNLCAVDRAPRSIERPHIEALFTAAARLIGSLLPGAETACDEARASTQGASLLALTSAMQQLAATLPLPDAMPQSPRASLAAARSLTRLIDTTVDYRHGAFDVHMSTRSYVFNFCGAVDEAVEAVTAEFPGRNIVVNCTVRRILRCDLRQMVTLMTQLLLNAAAYGAPASGISLVVSSEADDLLIEVWNAGNAIPESAMALIFGPLWRGANADAHAGLGLGLAIASNIVKAHDGTLSATSSTQDGTQFVAKIPLAQRIT